MYRKLLYNLESWKNSPRRKPLILRGARQVGKSWLVEQFGLQSFSGRIHKIDLELHPEWHRIFEGDLTPERILRELEVQINSKIDIHQDLLFFDEIQTCPRALMALRYFYEMMPALHVIAAGSLIDFVLEKISFPVGRVQFMEVRPMSYEEFLLALQKDKLVEALLEVPHKLPDSIHSLLIQHLREYHLVGGMPECVSVFAKTGSFQQVFDVQNELIASYRQDFPKYAGRSDLSCLTSVFTSVAKSVGQPIAYSRLADGYSQPTLKAAFQLLSQARVIRSVPWASPAGMPLGGGSSSKKNKCLFIDVGLMQRLSGASAQEGLATQDILAIYQGRVAEQFVGQELLTGQDDHQDDLFYWAREAKSSSAEVDFLTVRNSMLLPIEVKSGVSGKLKSLHILLQEYPHIQKAIVFSGTSFSEIKEQRLSFLPLYYAGRKFF